jgi:hypothetical protein
MALDYQQEILDWTLASLNAWGTALDRQGPDDWWAQGWNSARDDRPTFQLAQFGAKYDPAGWLERSLNQAERQAFSRAVKELDHLGLIVPIYRHGSRLSHIQLTPKGLIVALKLIGAEDLAGIRVALTTAKWATPAHLAAIRAAGQGGEGRWTTPTE